MAGDLVQEGFGANVPFIMTPGSNSVIVRIIASQTGGLVRIRRIAVAVLQTGGVFSATTLVPISVILGNASLGVGAVPGALSAPFHPSSTDLIGLPTQIDIGAFALKLATYLRVQNLDPMNFGDQDLVARNGEKLAVVLGCMVDGGVSPAVLGAGHSGTLTVLGDVEAIASDNGQSSSPFARTGSMPRFDVSALRFP